MDQQAKLLPAMAALYNFIIELDPSDVERFDEVIEDPQPGRLHPSVPENFSDLSTGVAKHAEKRRTNAILQRM